MLPETKGLFCFFALLLFCFVCFFFFLNYRKNRSKKGRLNSNKRMRRAGLKSQEALRGPRPAPTARKPTRGLYRKRWGRRRRRNLWTSTPGSTETRRKNVSGKLFIIYELDDLMKSVNSFFSFLFRYCWIEEKVWRGQTENSPAAGTEKVQTLLNQ